MACKDIIIPVAIALITLLYTHYNNKKKKEKTEEIISWLKKIHDQDEAIAEQRSKQHNQTVQNFYNPTLNNPTFHFHNNGKQDE